jgi:hypothetical protein
MLDYIIKKTCDDGFTSSRWSPFRNLKGFIVSVADDGGCGEIFHRNDQAVGFRNLHGLGPDFGNDYSSDLYISDNCHQNEFSYSELSGSYGGVDVDRSALFGQLKVRVVDYEVFKIVIK